MADRVRIFDTTLRDGEQAAGVSFSAEEKLQIAKLLEKMGVDCIEAGFAAASPADFDAVNRIAREVRGTQIASLCRAVPNDVDQGWERSATAKTRVCTSSSPPPTFTSRTSCARIASPSCSRRARWWLARSNT